MTFGTLSPRTLAAVAAAAAVLAAGCKKTNSATAPAPAANGGGDQVPISQLRLPPAGGGGAVAQAGGGADPATGLYGDQGGEETLPADKAPPGAPLRARKADPFYRLSNPRLEAPRGPFPGQNLVVDYRKLHDGPVAGMVMIVRTPDGQTGTVNFTRQLAGDHGQITVSSGFGPFSQLPRNAELYLTLTDHRYPSRPTFKVSNSVTVGNVTGNTLARGWTADEADTLRKPPPPKQSYDTPNLHPDVGRDTQLVGETTGGNPLRYADPDKPLLGFDYWMASWDNEPSPAGFVAVFAADQPAAPGCKRVAAKEGYAVGAVTVYTKKFVNALKLTYYKLNPDGTLDPSDTYDSEVFGTPQKGGKEVRLGGDGKRVLGFHCRKGAILNSVGLVTEK